MKLLLRLLIPLLAVASVTAAADHVVVLGFDGMDPLGIQKAPTPVMHDLMRRGAYTLHARAVIPTVSSPNWASMIMGAGPADHGITTNDWEPGRFDVPPVCAGPTGLFPTIFGLLRQQRPNAVIGVFHDWSGFARLFEKNVVDEVKHGDGPDATMDMAIRFLKARKPTLLFVHCDHVDHAGHTFAWNTSEYYAAVAKADALVGRMMAALEEAGIAGQTVVLITADHGGVGKGHGGLSLAELEIPWILAGPGVAAGKELITPVRTTDTAATIAYILGVTPHACWTGKPVMEAFSADSGRK